MSLVNNGSLNGFGTPATTLAQLLKKSAKYEAGKTENGNQQGKDSVTAGSNGQKETVSIPLIEA